MGRASERRAATKALVQSTREFLANTKMFRSIEEARCHANLSLAFSQYCELHPDPPNPADDNLWRCPHCDAERPGFGWQLNTGSYPDYDLQVLACFCRECRTLLNVNVVGYLPAAARAEMLRRMNPLKV